MPQRVDCCTMVAWAINSAEECYLHTVEVGSSNLPSPISNTKLGNDLAGKQFDVANYHQVHPLLKVDEVNIGLWVSDYLVRPSR